MDSDDEMPTLSAHALAALSQFNAEKDEHAQKFEKIKEQAEADAEVSMDAFGEDWQKSQFWYNKETAGTLARQLLDGMEDGHTIVAISAPSAFIQLKNDLRASRKKPKLVLLEHDERFRVFPEFVFYDFAQPFKLPAELAGRADAVICDPPFLSEDCQTKTAMTARWLLRKPSPGVPAPRVVVSTGERMQALVLKLFKSQGMRTTTFLPVHEGGLSNEFYCYANFECNDWNFREES